MIGRKSSGTGLTPSLTPHSIRPKTINPQPEPPGRPTPQTLKLNKISHKTINPQPEPPGRPAALLPGNNSTKTTSLNQTHLKSHIKPASGISNKSTQAVHPILAAKNVALTIKTPRERHKYLMTGKSVQITTKISNSSKAKLQIQLQKKQKNRFIDIHPRISQHYSQGQTIAKFTLNQRGEYQFRVKALAKNSKFGPWRTFLIDTLVKHSIVPKPAPIKPTSPKSSKPITTLHPALQHIR